MLDAGTLLSPHANDAGRARGEMPWFVVTNLRLLGLNPDDIQVLPPTPTCKRPELTPLVFIQLPNCLAFFLCRVWHLCLGRDGVSDLPSVGHQRARLQDKTWFSLQDTIPWYPRITPYPDTDRNLRQLLFDCASVLPGPKPAHLLRVNNFPRHMQHESLTTFHQHEQAGQRALQLPNSSSTYLSGLKNQPSENPGTTLAKQGKSRKLP